MASDHDPAKRDHAWATFDYFLEFTKSQLPPAQARLLRLYHLTSSYRNLNHFTTRRVTPAYFNDTLRDLRLAEGALKAAETNVDAVTQRYDDESLRRDDDNQWDYKCAYRETQRNMWGVLGVAKKELDEAGRLMRGVERLVSARAFHLY
jgi:hypothetical protein